MLQMKNRAGSVALVACLALAANAADGPYAPIDLADLKVDIKQMNGKRVAVKAQIQTMGEFSMLKSDPVDMTPVWAAVDALPREDRKKLANGCQMVMCGGTFYGVVQRGALGPTVSLQKVDWR